MPSASSKRIPVLLLALGTIAVIVALGAHSGRDRGIEVSTTRPVKQDLSSWISSNGKVEPIEPHILQAQLTAFIEKVSIKEGQTVSAGQTLATLDTRDLRTDLTHAREQLSAKESEALEAVKKTLKPQTTPKTVQSPATQRQDSMPLPISSFTLTADLSVNVPYGQSASVTALPSSQISPGSMPALPQVGSDTVTLSIANSSRDPDPARSRQSHEKIK